MDTHVLSLSAVDEDVADWYRKLPPTELRRILTSGYQLFYKPEFEIAARGGAGEEAVAEGLRDANYRIIDTHKKAASGDFAVYFESSKTLISVEIKNYEGPIGPQQLDKFKRDLSSPILVDGEPMFPSAGLFISLKRTIRRDWQDYHFDMISLKNRATPFPVIYLASSNIKTIKQALEDLHRWNRMPPSWVTGSDSIINITTLTETRRRLAESKVAIEKSVTAINTTLEETDKEIASIIKKLLTAP